VKLRFSRREVIRLAGSAVAGLVGGVKMDRVMAATGKMHLPGVVAEPLTDIAARRGLMFGSSFDLEAVDDNRYGALITRHCGILTTDYQLKFKTLRPTEQRINFSRADQLIEFAQANRLPVRGHALIWNENSPEWLSKLGADGVSYWLDRHISEVVARYAGKMHSWDVVNEPTWPAHGKPLGLRDGPWTSALGFDYIVRAFKRARAADPAAKLVLNEAWLERGDHWGQQLRPAFMDILQKSLDAGAPIDAVGLQCHLKPGNLAMDEFLLMVERLHALKIPVYVTELDVDSHEIKGSVDEVDSVVADMYASFLNGLLATGAVEVIQTWQLSDRYSFMREKYGRAARPLPFDQYMNCKPAYYSLANVLANANRQFTPGPLP